MSEIRRYVFQKECRAAVLRDELLAAGIAVARVNPLPGTCEVDVAPEDFDRAATVVQAHNPAAVDAAEAAKQSQYHADVAGLRAYQGLASPTLAQTVAATKAQNRILARVVSELRDLQ